MSPKDQRTRAFETIDNTLSESRRKVVIAIFIVVALILASFAILIIGKIASQLPEQPTPSSNRNMTYIPKDAGDIKIGNLLSVSDDFKHEMPSSFDNMSDIYTYISKNPELTEIDGYTTYLSRLADGTIALDTTVLNEFSKMILDYCETLDLNSANKDCASNLVVAWGGYIESTVDEYATDVSDIGKDYYDHILGTTLTFKTYEPSVAVTEDILKQDFAWIYENAHKYGFIIRYPEACKNHTGIDSSKRVHLRYIGAEHAAYIYQNNICFEEYLELLRNQHNSYDKAINIQIEDTTYLVYYVKYTGNPTSIPVPKNSTYTISGDNMNGFIVSVEK